MTPLFLEQKHSFFSCPKLATEKCLPAQNSMQSFGSRSRIGSFKALVTSESRWMQPSKITDLNANLRKSEFEYSFGISGTRDEFILWFELEIEESSFCTLGLGWGNFELAKKLTPCDVIE